jgi:hypothetical protein
MPDSLHAPCHAVRDGGPPRSVCRHGPTFDGRSRTLLLRTETASFRIAASAISKQQRCPVPLDLTLAIKPENDSHDPPMIVAARLVKMGAPMVSWQPEMNDLPAKATFKFKTKAARERFLTDALRIPGVSVVAPP